MNNHNCIFVHDLLKVLEHLNFVYILKCYTILYINFAKSLFLTIIILLYCNVIQSKYNFRCCNTVFTFTTSNLLNFWTFVYILVYVLILFFDVFLFKAICNTSRIKFLERTLAKIYKIR